MLKILRTSLVLIVIDQFSARLAELIMLSKAENQRVRQSLAVGHLVSRAYVVILHLDITAWVVPTYAEA